jgi:hypothetical protein
MKSTSSILLRLTDIPYGLQTELVSDNISPSLMSDYLRCRLTTASEGVIRHCMFSISIITLHFTNLLTTRESCAMGSIQTDFSKSGLIIVDVQNDFCPVRALANAPSSHTVTRDIVVLL